MLLEKKRGLLLLSSLFLALLIPLVSAQYEGVYSMFSFLFGAGENEAFMFLKAGIWIVLFAIIFWSAKKIFSGSKGVATIFAIVVSLISIRFIPDEYIFYIGSAYGVFGIVVLILAIIGGTLLILNSYFPIKEHKAFGVVWALFYFFIAWVFHQLTDIITGIYQVDELLPVMGPWGKWVCIILGIACLFRAISGKSTYARRPERERETVESEREPNEDESLRREELEEERRQRREDSERESRSRRTERRLTKRTDVYHKRKEKLSKLMRERNIHKKKYNWYYKRANTSQLRHGGSQGTQNLFQKAAVEKEEIIKLNNRIKEEIQKIRRVKSQI